MIKSLTEKDIKAMDDLGLHYDTIESCKGYHRFTGSTMPAAMIFTSVKRIRDYYKNVVKWINLRI